MAVEEEPVAPLSIKARIAALNIDQVAAPSPNGLKPVKKAPPPLPPKKRHDQTPQPTQAAAPAMKSHIPTRTNGDMSTPAKVGIIPPPGAQSRNGAAKPPLPTRPQLPARPQKSAAEEEQRPSLPARRPSETPSSRRTSFESTSSTLSGKASSLSSMTRANSSGESVASTTSNRIKAPPYDPSTLPPLPERRAAANDQNDRPALPTRRSTNKLAVQEPDERPALPSRTRTVAGHSANDGPKRGLPKRSPLEWGMNKDTDEAPQLPRRQTDNSATPPPVPLSSRPDLSELNKTKPRSNGVAANGAAGGDNSKSRCLICRDFRAVDEHAAKFPRQSIPSHDPRWIAEQLTAPFSTHLDKARAIFTWLHHNVEYDCKAILDKSSRVPMTPENTIRRGLAVCEGYARTYLVLAEAAGLECALVCGHGKGTGYEGGAGNVPPRDPTGHAWNAVKIEVNPDAGPSAGMYWKLIDPCWGAGAVNDFHEGYLKGFNPSWFIRSNEDFGLKHYPEEPRWFCRADGRVPSWEEYILSTVKKPEDEGPQTWSLDSVDPGLDNRSFEPRHPTVSVRDPTGGPTVRFSMRRKCPHWDPYVNGDGTPYLFLLKVGERPGYLKSYLPMHHDGYHWWMDVPRRELGKPGETVEIMTVGTVTGRDDCRGLTAEEWHRLGPKGGVSFNAIIVRWKLV